MEKEKILLNNLSSIKENLIEDKRNIIFINDLILQNNEEFDENSIKNSKFYMISENEIIELNNKINDALKDFSFDSCFDLYQNIKDSMEIIEKDLELINAFLKTKSEPEIIEYNLVRLNISKQIIILILNNIDEIINNLQKIIK